MLSRLFKNGRSASNGPAADGSFTLVVRIAGRRDRDSATAAKAPSRVQKSVASNIAGPLSPGEIRNRLCRRRRNSCPQAPAARRSSPLPSPERCKPTFAAVFVSRPVICAKKNYVGYLEAVLLAEIEERERSKTAIASLLSLKFVYTCGP
jgi:hypothetical protein